jgi:hypothetical protein
MERIGGEFFSLSELSTIYLPVTLKSAARHASNRQANTLESGGLSRSKAAADHAAIRHVFRRQLGSHLSGVSADWERLYCRSHRRQILLLI